MAGMKTFANYEDDFHGTGLLSATPSHDAWLIADTSAAGTPTFTRGGVNGEATLAFDSQNEIQNVCLYHGDDLNFDIDSVQSIELLVKQGQASIDATTSIAFGLGSARNDDPDSLAAAALFRLVGTNAVVVETDDSVNDNDDVATGSTLSNVYKRFFIDFRGGKKDVKFYIDGQRVAEGTTFDMSNYTGALQPMLQIQKTADANTDSVLLDYVVIESKR